MEKDWFADALGQRHRATDPDGLAVDVFRLNPELSAAATAESAVTARADRLSAFGHPGFASIRRVERVPNATNQLTIVSAAIPGIRLSELLRRGHERGVKPSPGCIRNLTRQIVQAMADFHRGFPDLAHGTLGPERVIVSPDGRAVIVEHLLAPVLGPLRMGRAALWTAFQIPVPSGAGTARFDQVTDVVQLGMLTLALVLGRPIGREEYPHEVERMLADAATPAGGPHPLESPAMRSWLLRCFQALPRGAFRTAAEAALAFEEVVDDEPRVKSRPSAVLAYLEAVEPGSTGTPAGGPSPSRNTSGGSAGSRVSAVRPSIGAPQPLKAAPGAAEGQAAACANDGRPTPIRSGWAAIRRRVGIAAGSLGLLAVLAVLYVGIRSYAHSPVSHVGHRALTTESRPTAPGARSDRTWPRRSPASASRPLLPGSRHPL